jgi:hypothetical protein
MAGGGDDLRGRLVQLIGAMRRRVRPEALEVATRFAEAAHAERQGKVLYDREQAHEAVRLFLAGKQGDRAFRRKLAEELRKPPAEDEG